MVCFDFFVVVGGCFFDRVLLLLLLLGLIDCGFSIYMVGWLWPRDVVLNFLTSCFFALL